MTVAGKILLHIDKVGNALSGGSIDNTISARTGYFSIRTDPNPFWKLMEAIINFAFWPIDGPDHCYQAYRKESDRDKTPDFRNGSKFSLAILLWIVVCSCTVIAPILWIIKAAKELIA